MVINKSLMVRLAMNICVIRRRIACLNNITLHTSRLPNNDTNTIKPYIIITEQSRMDNGRWRLNSIANRMISVYKRKNNQKKKIEK